MKVDVLLGLQWGDEGKGKVVDVLTPRYQAVARFKAVPMRSYVGIQRRKIRPALDSFGYFPGR